MSGAADPLTTGMMYCEIICAAQGLLMPDVAAQWTDVMERWRHGAAVGGINGRCRVHRAEVLRMSGTCDLAQAEALAACDELRPWMRREYGWPLVELGNVRLRAGDFDGAEEAYQQALDHAWSPQPGLALVHLARGDADLAATMIADAIQHPIDIPSKERPPYGPLRLAPLAGRTGGDRRDAEATWRHCVELPTSSARSWRSTRRPCFGRCRCSPTPVSASSRPSRTAPSRLRGPPWPNSSASERRSRRRWPGWSPPKATSRAAIPSRADFERRVARDALASFGSEAWAERVDCCSTSRRRLPSSPRQPASVPRRVPVRGRHADDRVG